MPYIAIVTQWQGHSSLSATCLFCHWELKSPTSNGRGGEVRDSAQCRDEGRVIGERAFDVSRERGERKELVQGRDGRSGTWCREGGWRGHHSPRASRCIFPLPATAILMRINVISARAPETGDHQWRIVRAHTTRSLWWRQRQAYVTSRLLLCVQYVLVLPCFIISCL